MIRRREAAAAAVAVGLVAFGVYLATMAPGLTWAHNGGDGGELAAAARTLGIAHPPGYPTYMLLAHPFTRLPVGELAARTNAFSAVCAAGAAALLAWTVTSLTGNGVAGAGAGLAFAVSPLLWSQAVITEVHTLNAFFAAMVLALVVQIRLVAGAERNTSRLAVILGVIWGLSLGNHLTAVFLVPLLIRPAPWSRSKALLEVLGVFLGLLVYLYLPLRAASGPPINWGNPETWRGFWWMVSGAPYRSFALSLPWAALPQRLLAWSRLVVEQLTALGLATASIGAVVLWSQDATLGLATTTVAVLSSIFAVGYDTTDSYVYLIPALVCLMFWLGLGMDWLLSITALHSGRPAAAASVILLLLPLVAGIRRVPRVSVRGRRMGRAFEASVLAPSPRGAVLISDEDACTFTLWYLKHGLGRRSDLVVVDAGLVRYNWYKRQLEKQTGSPLPAGITQLQDRQASIEASRTLGRPVCTVSSHPTPGLSCVDS